MTGLRASVAVLVRALLDLVGAAWRRKGHKTDSQPGRSPGAACEPQEPPTGLP